MPIGTENLSPKESADSVDYQWKQHERSLIEISHESVTGHECSRKLERCNPWWARACPLVTKDFRAT
ncbi:hypothetical protein [Trichocoleus sp. DQ-A3]|uniref:hypothetical protein n=1 Tax=Trichocoleus sp. DQ-A3 TaxID=2933925 RepID=UPI003297F252